MGALGLLWWSDEARQSPLANVCTEEIEPAYPECLTTEARRLAEAPKLQQLLTRFSSSSRQRVDTTKSVPRWQTERHREALRELAVRQAAWAACGN